jgi:hypothetical protein
MPQRRCQLGIFGDSMIYVASHINSRGVCMDSMIYVASHINGRGNVYYA